MFADPPVFVCPCCGQWSAHPEDVREGYCGRCHWQTGDPELGPAHMAGPCTMRDNQTRQGNTPWVNVT
jgi:hypothetical protein